MKLGTGRYGSLLARLLTGTSALEVAEDLSPEISPVITLENDRPEWEFLKNGRLCGCVGFITAGAVDPGILRIFNPSAQSILAVVESIRVSSTSGANVQIHIGTNQTALATPVVNVVRDIRIRTAANALAASGLNTSLGTAAAPSGTLLERFGVLASTPTQFSALPVILAPSGSLDISIDTVTISAFVTLRWREREIGKYERLT